MKDLAETIYSGSLEKFFDIVDYNPKNRYAEARKSRERYLSMVEQRDGKKARKELTMLFRQHPFQDPARMAHEIGKGYLICGVASDLDCTLISNRTGDSAENVYKPGLAESIKKVIDMAGTFTVTTASDYKRVLYLADKSKGQVPVQKMVFFAENGSMAITPKENDDEFRLLEKVLPNHVYDVNGSLMEVLDSLSKISVGDGLLMFPNRDKISKVTLELLNNGDKKNQRVLDDIVMPYICSEFGMEKGSVKRHPTGKRVFKLEDVSYEVSATPSSIEFDHQYLPTKETVNSVLAMVMGRNIDIDLRGTGRHIAFIGLGDSPFGGDFGITSQNYQNIGIKISPSEYRLKESDRLVEIIRKDLKEGIVSLPVFGEDPDGIPKRLLGAGDAAAHYLNGVMDSAGYVVFVKDHAKYLTELEKALYTNGFVESGRSTAIPQNAYAFPKYLEDSPCAEEMKGSFNASVPESGINSKIRKLSEYVRSGRR